MGLMFCWKTDSYWSTIGFVSKLQTTWSFKPLTLYGLSASTNGAKWQPCWCADTLTTSEEMRCNVVVYWHFHSLSSSRSFFSLSINAPFITSLSRSIAHLPAFLSSALYLTNIGPATTSPNSNPSSHQKIDQYLTHASKGDSPGHSPLNTQL